MVHAETSKNEDTWREALGIAIPNTVNHAIGKEVVYAPGSALQDDFVGVDR